MPGLTTTFQTVSKQVRYFNLGIGYNMSKQTVLRLNKHVLPLKLHVVLVQIGVNDFRSILLQPAKRTEVVQASYVRQISNRSSDD